MSTVLAAGNVVYKFLMDEISKNNTVTFRRVIELNTRKAVDLFIANLSIHSLIYFDFKWHDDYHVHITFTVADQQAVISTMHVQLRMQSGPDIHINSQSTVIP